jgi:acetyl esterase/lipase
VKSHRRVALVVVVIAGIGVALALLPRGTNPVTAQRDLAYSAPGGAPLLLDAYVPNDDRGQDGDDGRPGVILVHGGGWDSGSRLDVEETAAELARYGWSAFAIDYRLDAPRYPAQADDVANAVRWVRGHAAEFGVDPARLALFGFSAGGNLAGLAATRDEGPTTADARVAVLASWSGVFDLPLLVPGDDGQIPECTAVCEAFWSNGRLLENYVGCDYATCPQQYEAASPVTRLDPSDPPTLVANATEEITPVSQPDAMADALATAQIVHDVELVPGSDHAQQLTADAWPATLTFLAAGLGEPAPRFPVLSDAARTLLAILLFVVLAVPIIVVARSHQRRAEPSS